MYHVELGSLQFGDSLDFQIRMFGQPFVVVCSFGGGGRWLFGCFDFFCFVLML